MAKAKATGKKKAKTAKKAKRATVGWTDAIKSALEKKGAASDWPGGGSESWKGKRPRPEPGR